MSAPALAPSAPDNPLRALRLAKIVINIGVGEAGDRRTRAERVIQMLTSHKPVATRARGSNRDLGVRVGMEIGAKVTLRGADATRFLERALATRENQLDPASIDRNGHLSFGVPDYTDFDGMKYDPKIGIYGLDVSVEITRSGARVRSRARSPRPLPHQQRVAPEETRRFLAEKFAVKFLE